MLRLRRTRHLIGAAGYAEDWNEVRELLFPEHRVLGEGMLEPDKRRYAVTTRRSRKRGARQPGF
jgi:hypothetical protein